MWWFMYACYLLTGISFCLVGLTGIQGYWNFSVLGVAHQTFALVAAIVYLFTETLIIFFFVGTGSSIKEFSQMHHLGPEYHQRSISIKRVIYPPTLLNILLLMIVFVIGGGVHTRMIHPWFHGGLFLVTIIHFAKTIAIQHRSFKESTMIFIELSKLDLNK